MTEKTEVIFHNFIEMNDELYFYAQDEEHGAELWKTNGTTEEGTIMVVDLNPGYKYPHISIKL